ncbi:DUF835 domain-containing protein [Thermococcus gammatolerans]|uniref:DUF835 domain-containing protein n=1 Tax=Thermococcus gammatolerans (strain DSM 15229 / JCM 11827 / EJ3) TaxID=593117 RepID=C5A6X5_THEGJ|nr:DUF835 domain-containing protein [Thermococcus gammatolerans]ACS33987.1 Conserved hypothetical protein [Thermococcus gammatolerans EJ3]
MQDSLIVIAGALIVMGIDVLAALLIFSIYRKNRRTSALLFSMAWLCDFLAIATSSSLTLKPLGLLLLPLFSSFMFAASFHLVEEEGVKIDKGTLKVLSTAPVAYMIYLLMVYWYTQDPEWTATAAASLGITGVFVTASGLIVKNVVSIYQSAAKYLYIGITLFGLHLIPAALFGQERWYIPIGFMLSASLIVLMTTAMVKIMRSESFRRIPLQELPQEPETELESPVAILHPEELQKIKEEFKDFPVLAFLRNTRDVPEAWRVYFMTTAPLSGEREKTIGPTELPRIGEIIYRYLQEMKSKNLRGVVLFDCIEYLLVYNSQESLLKFLAKVRDFVVMSNGFLILAVDPRGVEPHFIAQLRRILL